MKTYCANCGNENPKSTMKLCCRKCTDIYKSKINREKRICLHCKNEFEVRKSNPKTICSEQCRKEWVSLPENIENRIAKHKKAIIEKYGVENVFQLEEIKNKSKKTKLEKYGDENFNDPEKQMATLRKKYGEDYCKLFYKRMSSKFIETYGVEHPLQRPEGIEKLKQTNMERYGVEFVSQNETFQKKAIATTIEKFGVENASQNEEIKKKKKETSMKNFGVEHHLKDYDMFQKHLKSQYKTLQYRDTDLYYQGTYELYFLEKMDEAGLLDELNNGRSYEYEWLGEKHTYHTDFYFRNKNIEIKSGWTYDKNGTDIELKEFNETKWQSVRNSDNQIIVLINKSEIEGFIKALV